MQACRRAGRGGGKVGERPQSEAACAALRVAYIRQTASDENKYTGLHACLSFFADRPTCLDYTHNAAVGAATVSQSVIRHRDLPAV